MGVTIATAPSQLTFAPVLRWLGVPPVNYSAPGFVDYGQIVFHVAVTASLFYLLGYSIEWLVRRLMSHA